MNLLINLKYQIFFVLLSYQKKLQSVECCLSRINTSRNKKLKMFLLSAKNNFYITSSSYVEGHVKKHSSLNFMPVVGFQASKIWMFSKFTMRQVLKSFSGRNNFSQRPLLFSFLLVFHMV